MLAKRTKSGRLSLNMSFAEREKLFGALCNFLEDESLKLNQIKMRTQADVMRRLHYYTLTEIVVDKNLKLQLGKPVKIIFTMAQSSAMLWLLHGYDDDMVMLSMKSALHKLLV